MVRGKKLWCQWSVASVLPLNCLTDGWGWASWFPLMAWPSSPGRFFQLGGSMQHSWDGTICSRRQRKIKKRDKTGVWAAIGYCNKRGLQMMWWLASMHAHLQLCKDSCHWHQLLGHGTECISTDSGPFQTAGALFHPAQGWEHGEGARLCTQVLADERAAW